MINKLFSPPHFYRLVMHLVPYVVVLGSILTLVGVIWGLAFAPTDYQQGNSFRIIYVHVSAASLSLAIYFAMSVAAIVDLIWRLRLAVFFQIAAAPVGASLCVLAIVTGSIWGKPTWGAWWVWDARLTSMLVLCFIFFGLILLVDTMRHHTFLPRVLSIITLVGSVNLPIIKYSVEWWHTLHQPATFTITQLPKMAPQMYIPLLFCILGFSLLVAAAIGLRMCYMLLTKNRDNKWVQDAVR